VGTARIPRGNAIQMLLNQKEFLMPVSESEIIAELTFSGDSINDYFLIDNEICSTNLRGELVAMVVEEEEMYHAMVAFLLRNGAKRYRSREDYKKQRREA
jgi:hypothetical protein